MGNANSQSLSMPGAHAHATDRDGMGLDSSANFRALLNQQISFFNNPDPSSTAPPNVSQGLTMPPMQEKQELTSSPYHEHSGTASTAPAGNNSAENEALIRQLEQQLFEAQAMNGGGMGGLMGFPRGSGN